MRRMLPSAVILLSLIAGAVLIAPRSAKNGSPGEVAVLASADYAAACRHLDSEAYATGCGGRAIEGHGIVTRLGEGVLWVRGGPEGEPVGPGAEPEFALALATPAPEDLALHAEIFWEGRLDRRRTTVPRVASARVREVLQPAEAVDTKSCREAWSACADTTEIVRHWRGLPAAQARCRQAAGEAAFGESLHLPDPAFIRYRVEDAPPAEGTLTLVEKDAYRRTRSGERETTTLICHYDLVAEAVESLVAE